MDSDSDHGEKFFRDVSMGIEGPDSPNDPEPSFEEVKVDTTISHDTTEAVDVLFEEEVQALHIDNIMASEDVTLPDHDTQGYLLGTRRVARQGISQTDSPIDDNLNDVNKPDDNESGEDADHMSRFSAQRESKTRSNRSILSDHEGLDPLMTADKLREAPTLPVCEQGPYARTLDFLLATISKLEAENAVLKKQLLPARDDTIAIKADHEVPTEDQFVDQKGLTPLIYETFHIVYHTSGGNQCFRDVPRKFKGDWAGDKNCNTAKDHLRGLDETENMTNYLKKNTRTVFGIIHKYSCDDFINDTLHIHTGRKGARFIRDTHPCESHGEDITFSDALEGALKTIIDKHPARFKGIKTNDFVGHVRSPYLLFYLHNKTFQDLSAMSDLDEDDCTRVSLLCKWLEENYRKDWDEADELLSRGKINNKHFPKLIRPEEVVVQKNADPYIQFTACKVKPYPWHNQDLADIYYWNFNGSFHMTETFLQTTHKDNSAKDDEEKDITSLEYYPIRFASKDLFSKLVARGEKFWKYRSKKIACYRDPELPHQEENVSRYIIDYDTFKRIHPRNPIFNVWLDKEIMDFSEPPDEDFLAMLPGMIMAFSFLTKAWKPIRVEFLTDVTWNKDAFKRLVVPDDTKDLIKGLIRAQNKPSGAPLDIIAGKGNGLLMLLHGPPGTGKTLTAESIAEFEERPLYRVTGGDVGLEPSTVERYLTKVFELGKAWGCVVLLDEADVFIEARGFERLERNALISVFLRVLEYYEGILILTTNRVGTFDEAFKSRIQLALSYPKLDRIQRRKIWQNFFNMIREYRESINIQDLELNIDVLADVDINGRQIRNALTTARHLAEFKKERLVYGHLKLTIGKIQKFDEYIKEVQYDKAAAYLDDEDVARELKLR